MRLAYTIFVFGIMNIGFPVFNFQIEKFNLKNLLVVSLCVLIWNVLATSSQDEENY